MDVAYDLASIGLQGLVTPGYSFSNCVLSSLLPTPYDEAYNALDWLLGINQIYLAYRKIYPDDYKNRLGPLDIGTHTLAQAIADPEEPEISKVILKALEKLFPIYDEAMYVAFHENEGALMIYLEPQHSQIMGDDIEEMLNNPAEVPAQMSPILFFRIFDSQYGREAWEVFRERFGWPVQYIDLPNFEVILDDELCQRLLRENGLYPFYDLWMAVAYNTGNPFIDFDENDPYGLDWELTAENIVTLQGLWAQAQPILENCKAAERMALENPDIYIKLAELLRQSFKPIEKQKEEGE